MDSSKVQIQQIKNQLKGSVETKIIENLESLQIIYQMSSNISTGLTVAAGMIGSLTLVLPQLFYTEGIISCLIGMIFMGVIYCRTCQLWMIHWKPGEEDISQIVKRTLGKVWFIVLGVSSGILLLLICVIYFLLLNKTLYPVIAYVLKHVFHSDKFHDGTDGIHFDKFSIQYLGFIVLVCLLPLYNLKSIDWVVKFAKYGVTFLIIYFFTLVAMFITNVSQNGFHPDKIKLVPSNFNGWVDILGQFSLAFVSHNTIITVTKNNHSRRQIPRAIAYGFLFAGILYALFGIFGGMAKVNKDYFNQSPFLLIIGVAIFFYVIFIYGIFPFVSRAQFFCWRQSKEPLPKLWFYGYNLGIIIVCGIMQTLNISPGLVIAVTGTGVGIITCFVLPIWIHLRCYKPSPSHINSIITDAPYENRYINRTQIEESLQSDSPLLPPESVNCVAHDDTRVPYSVRVIVCSILMVIGVTNFALQIKLMV